VRHEGPTIPFLALFLALAFARQGGPTIPFLVLAFARQLGPTIPSAACARGGVMRAGVAATRPPATVSSAAALLRIFRRPMVFSPMWLTAGGGRLAACQVAARGGVEVRRGSWRRSISNQRAPCQSVGRQRPPQSSIRLEPSCSVLRPRPNSWEVAMPSHRAPRDIVPRPSTVQVARNSFPFRPLARASRAISQAAAACGKKSLGRP